MTWAVIIALLLIVLGLFIRRNYGDVLKIASRNIEERIGPYWTLFVKALPFLTLLVWAVIYVTSEETTGLEELFESFRHPFLKEPESETP